MDVIFYCADQEIKKVMPVITKKTVTQIRDDKYDGKVASNFCLLNEWI